MISDQPFKRYKPGRKVKSIKTMTLNEEVQRKKVEFGDRFSEIEKVFYGMGIEDLKRLAYKFMEKYKIHLSYYYSRSKDKILVWMCENWEIISNDEDIKQHIKSKSKGFLLDTTNDSKNKENQNDNSLNSICDWDQADYFDCYYLIDS